jgi:hypothetical protein
MFASSSDAPLKNAFLRFAVNPENPVGTIQSIKHTLRSLDNLADHEQERSLRMEKALADYQAQADKPFDHEARMNDLLARQAQLNAVLDLRLKTSWADSVVFGRTRFIRQTRSRWNIRHRNQYPVLVLPKRVLGQIGPQFFQLNSHHGSLRGGGLRQAPLCGALKFSI